MLRQAGEDDGVHDEDALLDSLEQRHGREARVGRVGQEHDGDRADDGQQYTQQIALIARNNVWSEREPATGRKDLRCGSARPGAAGRRGSLRRTHRA